MTESTALARSLIVPRDELTRAAKRLKRAVTQGRLRSSHLVIRYESGHAMLEIPGGAEGVVASGYWPGLVRAPSTILLLLAKGEPSGDPVELAWRDGYLYVLAGGVKIRFKTNWEDISPPRIEVALDATDRDYLRLARTYALAQITSSGLDKLVAAAELRFQAAVDRAHVAVKKYGMSRADLESALRELINKEP